MVLHELDTGKISYSLVSEALKWVTFGGVLLLGYWELVPKSGPPFKKGACWTLLDAANVFLSIVAAALAAFKGYMQISAGEFYSLDSPELLRYALSNISVSVSLILMTFITIFRLQRALGPSGLVCSLLLLLVTSTVTDFFQMLRRLYNQAIQSSDVGIQDSVIITNSVLLFVMLGNFLGSGIRSTVFMKKTSSKTKANELDEDDVSPFAKIFCVALYPLIRGSMSSGTSTEDVLPVLRRSFRCGHLVKGLYGMMKDRLKIKSRRRYFVSGILRVLWLDACWVGITTLAYYASLIVRVPLLQYLIKGGDPSTLVLLAVLFIITCVAEFLLSNYTMILTLGFGSRIRSMLQGAIFKKMTELSPTARHKASTGQVVSMLAVDCYTISMSMFLFPMPLAGIICMPVVLYLLAERVGTIPTLCCTAWFLLALILPFPTSRIQKFLWVRTLKARDERLKRMSDLLSSIRLVKMYAWEGVYREKVEKARDAEMSPMFRINLLDGIIDSLYSATSSVLIIILFGTLALVDPTRSVTPDLSFTCVYLLSVTDVINAGAALFLRNRSQVSLALTRIVTFCTEEENPTRTSAKGYPARMGTVALERCSFAWTKEEDGTANPVLSNVSVYVEPGSLVGVVGFTGAGKSSLIAAILGDIHCLTGNVNVVGRTGYVSQLPSVHNMTVRDNILYGEEMDDARYDRVLHACQLMDDLNQFPAGDLTEVGEKGETLSGGQKQRIALARAAYNPCDVYLFDDPLSALDPRVAAKVFQEVIGNDGILKGKTRILVSNQGDFLGHVDLLLLVHDKAVIPCHSVAELLHDPRIPESIRGSLASSTATDAMPEDHSNMARKEVDDSKGAVTQQEQSFATRGGIRLSWALGKLLGFWAPLAMLAFVGSGVCYAWQLMWIKEWMDASTLRGSDANNNRDWIKILIAISVADVAFRSIGSTMLAAGARQLSRSLHNGMLARVLASPWSFFDATPRGRIINRFSVDLDAIDSRMYLSGKQSIQNALLMVAKLVTVGIQTPLVLVVGAIAAVLFGFVTRVSVHASHRARYCETVRTSRMLQHLTETMDCLTTVRAYGVVDRFCSHFCHLADLNMRAYFSFCGCFRFIRLVSSAIVLVVVIVTVVTAALLEPFNSGGNSSSSTVGLALSAALAIPISMMTLCIVMFSYLQTIVSFERTLEYTELPPEVDVEPQPSRQGFRISWIARTAVQPVPETQWPSEGRIKFQNLSASYRPGELPDVLRGVTFLIDSEERVGVVGRTGAGKSSLVLALLRVLRASEGRILIDDIDIASVPLRKLRNAVTVIPQDPSLIRGSLRDNLDPARSHSDEEVWDALRQAHLDAVVRRDPKKLLMETGDGGANLSVGQRQLACLARALLRRPRVLLLDEATSKMDGDTDRLIQKTLREGFRRCTVLTIAHRINTVLDYDKILVMSEGRVLEFGSVGQLLSNPSSAFRSMAYDSGAIRTIQDDGDGDCTTQL